MQAPHSESSQPSLDPGEPDVAAHRVQQARVRVDVQRVRLSPLTVSVIGAASWAWSLAPVGGVAGRGRRRAPFRGPCGHGGRRRRGGSRRRPSHGGSRQSHGRRRSAEPHSPPAAPRPAASTASKVALDRSLPTRAALGLGHAVDHRSQSGDGHAGRSVIDAPSAPRASRPLRQPRRWRSPSGGGTAGARTSWPVPVGDLLLAQGSRSATSSSSGEAEVNVPGPGPQVGEPEPAGCPRVR